jgi:hypothetical protein
VQRGATPMPRRRVTADTPERQIAARITAMRER